MAKQFFMLMQDDHRSAKNILQAELREKVKANWSQKLTSSPEVEAERLNQTVDICNGLHPKSTALRPYLWKGTDKYPGANDSYCIDGLFKLVFFPVKESTAGKEVTNV